METPIQELVYAKITGLEAGKDSVLLKFCHASGKAADHRISPDKMKKINCYNQLEIGCHYIIVTENTGPRRWQWRKCILVSPKEMMEFRKIAGLTPTFEEMSDAMAWLKEERNPTPKNLTDLVEW